MVVVRGAVQESCLLRCFLISSSTSSSGPHDRPGNVRMHTVEGGLVSLRLVDSQLPWLDTCKKWMMADCLVTGSQGCLGGSKEIHSRGVQFGAAEGRPAQCAHHISPHQVSWLEDLTFTGYFGASEMLSYRWFHVINSQNDTMPGIQLSHGVPIRDLRLGEFQQCPRSLLPWPALFLSLHLLFHTVVKDSQMGNYFIDAHTHTHTHDEMSFIIRVSSLGETSL